MKFALALVSSAIALVNSVAAIVGPFWKNALNNVSNLFYSRPRALLLLLNQARLLDGVNTGKYL